MTVRRQILLLILFVLIVVYLIRFFQIDFDRQLPDPPLVITQSFHEDGNEEAWIMKVESDGSAWVQMVDDKTNVHFRPLPLHLYLFSDHINQIAAVTFECGKKPEEECNLSKPFRLYIKNVPVELIEVHKKAVK